MNQTAVEWLIKEYSKYVDDSNVPFSVLEKAKEMERLQISEIYYEAFMNAVKGLEDEYNDNLNEK